VDELTAGVPEWLWGFLSVLALPFLGVLALMRRRATPWFLALLGAWLLLGLALALGWLAPLGWGAGASRPWIGGWSIGLALCGCFLALAWLRERRRLGRYLELGLALLSIAAFVRALALYVQRYA
jgi:hypothetical protein